MDKYIFNVTNGLWYELVGDYYFPCLTVPTEEEQLVGVWGQRHKRFLKECRPALYNALLLSGKLNGYLADIDRQAQERLDTVIEQMAQSQGIANTINMKWITKEPPTLFFNEILTNSQLFCGFIKVPLQL